MSEHEFEGIGRVLAFDVRTRWVAHAAFDASAHLLDSGASRFASPRAAEARFSFLIELLHPTTIVFRKMSPRSGRNRPKTRKLVRLMRRACREPSLRVALVSETQLRNCFKIRDAKTKHEIASVLAKDFPVLAWKLPPPRRNYDHEHWNMPMFDAVALGVAYFSNSTKGERRTIGE
jgi:hypothetical protein